MPEHSVVTRASRWVGGALAAVSLIAGAASCGPRDARRAQPTPAAAGADGAPARAGFDKLVGRWLRTDGGYVLEIRAVSPEGRVEASYLNPRPINVARAQAARGGDLVTLLVELRDVNYPGSTYNLWYDDGRDLLEGTYYQAAQQQTYDVVFERQTR